MGGNARGLPTDTIDGGRGGQERGGTRRGRTGTHETALGTKDEHEGVGGAWREVAVYFTSS